MQLSRHSLDRFRADGEFIFSRVQTERPSVLLLAPASGRLSPETLKKIDHEYSLTSASGRAWGVSPFAVSAEGGQVTLVLEDSGGETFDGFLSVAMEMTEFFTGAFDIIGRIGSQFKTAFSEWARITSYVV